MLYIPHKVSGYFDKTTNNLIDIIFEDRFIKLYQITVSLYKVLDDYIETKYTNLRKLRYHLLYLLYKFINKDVDIDTLEKYFIKDKNKKNFEELKDKELAEQNDLIDKIYSNLHYFSKDAETLGKIVDYLVEVIKNEYPILINLDTREKEKILYKTVDKTQRGEQLFGNFDKKFTKNMRSFINGTN